MLFKLLDLFGLDASAKMAAAKAIIEQRAEEVSDYAKHATQTAAIIAALTAFAAVLVAMVIGVGLLALYWVVADSYGVDAGLDVVAGVLLMASPLAASGAPPPGALPAGTKAGLPLPPLPVRWCR